MIKVTRATAADGEVELVVTAARFFIDRLIPVAKQKKLSLNIDVTDMPGRTPIAIKWLVGRAGLFSFKPPRHFEMAISTAAGVKDGLEIAANEIVHVAQIVSGRLKIQLKKRKVNGRVEEAYAASWMGGKYLFVDMTPRPDRLWETEASALKKQLVEEFLTWSAGQFAKLPTQRPSQSHYGLYAIRPTVIAAPVSIPAKPDMPAPRILQTDHQIDVPQNAADSALVTDDMAPASANPAQPVARGALLSGDRPKDMSHNLPKDISKNLPDDLPDDLPSTPAKDMPADDIMVLDTPVADHKDIFAPAIPPQKGAGGTYLKAPPPPDSGAFPRQQIAPPIDMDIGEFKIAVEVPRLGMARMLSSAMLQGKLNDLLERGLIAHDAARTALREAQQTRARS